ncbi:vesicular acetylcholine transporter isoform X2 [Patella vulgata]|uniref:vesicular acetylcholine transporter isoform X2 n=1 Tax=Patella vulgata TaxID=6465 RepID=UPI0024A96821|nr:vesicular acetylcholine transporter isoform X2 [Patella vulgata]
MGLVPQRVSEKTSLYFQKFQQRVNDPTHQRRLVLVTVCIALLLDNMLYMVIVPIIPNYLRDLNGVTYGNWSNLTQYYAQFTTPRPPNGTNGSDHSFFDLSEWKKKLPPPPITYGTEGGAIGVLFASKAIMQLMVNPFTGALIDRIGYDYPMMIGLIIMFFSTSVFAFGESYLVLFFARSLQGVGSAFADTSGLAMIADRYTEETERSKALGIALAFISFGCLFAPPFGGILYQFAGKVVPFLVLACLCLVDGILLLTVMKPVRKERAAIPNEERPKGTPIHRLLLDPFIAIVAGALAMSNVALAFLEPTISLWMKDTMGADDWAIGFVWLPAFIPHVVGVYLTVKLARTWPNRTWMMAAGGLAMEGCFCLILPFSHSYGVVIVPIMGICFGIALVDTALLPTLGYLVDVRYVSVYGSVYAIADIAYSVAYAFGPIVAGSVVHAIGFLWLNILIFITNVGYAPLLFFLRRIYEYKPFENECDVLVDDPPSKHYMTYVQNGGVDGKPSPLEPGHINHLKIGKQKSYDSEELDCYPPNDSGFIFDKDTSGFYQR